MNQFFTKITIVILVLTSAFLFSCTKSGNPNNNTSNSTNTNDTSNTNNTNNTNNNQTTDSGQTNGNSDTLSTGWSKLIVPGNVGFTDVFFNNNDTGYLVGPKIYNSTDGGKTWHQKFSSGDFHDIFVTANGKAYFADAHTGLWSYTPGATDLIESLRIAPVDEIVTDVFFVDDNTGYYLDAGSVHKTIDGGLTWKSIDFRGITFGFSSLFFINDHTGWIFSGKQLYKSDGASVSPPIFSGSVDFTSVKAVSPSVVFVANFNGEIFKSTDGGSSFSLLIRLSAAKGFTDLHFIDDKLGYASCGKCIYKTTDAGLTWTKVVSLAETEITELHFTDENHGWACGSKGTVLIFKP